MSRRNAKGLIIGGLVAGGLILLSRRSSAASPPGVSSPPPAVDMQLSPHFRLSEFQRSHLVPQIAYHVPTATELANLRALVAVLELLRARFGPVTITGGVRPNSVRNAAGQTITDLLLSSTDPTASAAAKDGDHVYYNASDVALPAIKTLDGYREAFAFLQALPAVRQVLLELRRVKDGSLAIHHLHVAAVVPGRPRLPSERFAFVTVDGKRTESVNA